MYSFLKNYGLAFMVFFTGSCILIVEIVAVRILSPYFGNTIFSFSSVISTILAALSIGYFYGGRLADKRPEFSLFYNLIALSGALVLFIYLLMIFALPVMGETLSLMYGPLITSLVLFFVPATIMGTLSPFAVKLQTDLTPDRGAGQVAGEIFFWSTLGSIVGSVGTGFMLIPLIGTSKIILSVGFVLTAVGLALAFAVRNGKKKLNAVTAVLSIVITVGVFFSHTQVDENTLYVHDGLYERVSVEKSTWFGRPAHILKQDRTHSAAIYLDNPDELAFQYTQYIHAYKYMGIKPKNALFIGGGGYIMPEAFLNEIPADGHIDVAEIEPELYELSLKYLDVREDPRMRNIIADGRRAMRDSDIKYDLIFSDVYFSLYSVPPHLTTVEFFEEVKDALTDDGIFMANIIGNIDATDKRSFVLSEIRTIRQVFPNVQLFATLDPDSPKAQNFIVLAHKQGDILDVYSDEVLDSKYDVVREMHAQIIHLEDYDLTKHIVLTDDYAPVEYLTAALLRDKEKSRL